MAFDAWSCDVLKILRHLNLFAACQMLTTEQYHSVFMHVHTWATGNVCVQPTIDMAHEAAPHISLGDSVSLSSVCPDSRGKVQQSQEHSSLLPRVHHSLYPSLVWHSIMLTLVLSAFGSAQHVRGMLQI